MMLNVQQAVRIVMMLSFYATTTSEAGEYCISSLWPPLRQASHETSCSAL